MQRTILRNLLRERLQEMRESGQNVNNSGTLRSKRLSQLNAEVANSFLGASLSFANNEFFTRFISSLQEGEIGSVFVDKGKIELCH